MIIESTGRHRIREWKVRRCDGSGWYTGHQWKKKFEIADRQTHEDIKSRTRNRLENIFHASDHTALFFILTNRKSLWNALFLLNFYEISETVEDS